MRDVRFPFIHWTKNSPKFKLNVNTLLWMCLIEKYFNRENLICNQYTSINIHEGNNSWSFEIDIASCIVLHASTSIIRAGARLNISHSQSTQFQSQCGWNISTIKLDLGCSRRSLRFRIYIIVIFKADTRCQDFVSSEII